MTKEARKGSTEIDKANRPKKDVSLGKNGERKKIEEGKKGGEVKKDDPKHREIFEEYRPRKKEANGGHGTSSKKEKTF